MLGTERIDYPGFDLTQHATGGFRPGDEAELFGPSRWHWTSPRPGPPAVGMLIIEGLNGNRWAILIKIHHYGRRHVGGPLWLGQLCDDADGSAFANNVDIKQIPPYGDARSAETLWRMSVSIAGAVCTAAARVVSWPGSDVTGRPGHHQRRGTGGAFPRRRRRRVPASSG
ncbi:hypothetical protein ACQKB2_18085 [Mycobacterium tuberculosis]